jgi:hypothetical protein
MTDANNNTELFISLGKCIVYLRKNKGLTATQTTLVKYIDTGKPYHGYIFLATRSLRAICLIFNK